MTAAQLRAKTVGHGVHACSPVVFRLPDGTILRPRGVHAVAVYAEKIGPNESPKLASVPNLVIELEHASE